MNRLEKRVYRISLVRNLEDLETIHCRVCTIREENSQISAEKTCGLCPIYKEIRTIGELLSPAAKSSVTKIKPIREEGNEGRTRTHDVINVINQHMSVEQYLEYKKLPATDIEIAKGIGVSRDSMQRWKREKGLIGKKANRKVGLT